MILQTHLLISKQLFMKGVSLNSNKGFTLIEALVAITILLLGVLGPLSAATRGITDGMIAKSQIVALGLAQEAIELTKAKIDSNTRVNLDWMDGLVSCLVNNVCRVEVSSNDYEICDPDQTNLNNSTTCWIQSDNQGIYVPLISGSTNGQMFHRTIQITPTTGNSILGDDAEAKVVVVVGWQDKGQWRSTTLTNYIYNY